MILKQSDERRSDLAELTRLASRCNTAQKRKLDNEYKKLTAGIRGERDAAHVMNRTFGEAGRVGLLHDLRIGVRGEFAQIDHLVIHRVQGRIWLCETKNYGGRLQCNEHGEWTVWYGKKPKPVSSPIQQARLQAIVLRRWLEENGYGYLEVLPLVLIAPTASVDRRHVPEDVTIVKWDQFGDWWERQAADLSALSAVKMAAGAFWEKRDKAWLSEFGEKLCRAHTPIVFDWEARLGLEQADGSDTPCEGSSSVHPLSASDRTPPEAKGPVDEPGLDLSPLKTPDGDITFIALGDTEVAIRNAAIEPLIEAVRGTVKGRGRWQPRYKNWIVKVEDFAEVRCQIEARLAEVREQRRA
ncbi:nuclease-related domain-containing protein [Erythrobacter sp.]|uniref:nuclease-related domain-containing protein n=1 Tax=Erythrobacter sp. TaxID=1042 RepID=UPI003C711A98